MTKEEETKDTNIYETIHYYVRIGKSVHTEGPTLDCYQIINKEFGIVESESSMWPAVVRNVEEMEAAYPSPEDNDQGGEILTLN